MSKQDMFGGDSSPSSTDLPEKHQAYSRMWDLSIKTGAQKHGRGVLHGKDEKGPQGMPVFKRWARIDESVKETKGTMKTEK